ncbi:ribonuclease H family protein [Ligilactobacillus salitolerans]|uniref:ribonuclease H family protein n=1 Tax=Ligilactobacillus salitolerans TaxID=1808352 RepID=UPI00157F86EE|nr:ribonuclease H family protein [Ligilactobacillus salitolerans]
MAAKYYAVLKGRKKGMFSSWAECEKQVKGYPGAKFKSFTNKAEADDWLANAGQEKLSHTQSKRKKVPLTKTAGIQFWTDGGSRNHGNKKGQHVKKNDPAAWAFCVVKDGKKYTASGGEYGSTNNRMEVMALVKALKFLGRQGWQDEEILAILDSKYVLDAITKNWLTGWKKRGWVTAGGKPVANQELWQEMTNLLPYFSKLDFQWTKGHARNAGNILVDKLLNETMDQM